MGWRLTIVAGTLILLASRFTYAESPADSLTLGLRLGALIAQERLASPPLPSLGRDPNHHVRPQAAYITGSIYSTFGQPDVPGGSRYTGTPVGYSGGLAYTSPSFGPLSAFVFGIFAKSQADFEMYLTGQDTPDISIFDNRSTTYAGGAGLNYVLLGDSKSFFATGVFAGGFYSRTSTSYEYVYTIPIPGVATNYYPKANSKEYGPNAGLQARLRLGPVSVTSYGMYAYDVSDKCLAFDLDGNPFPCLESIDNSFASFGTSVALWGFGFTVYSRVWSKIDVADINMRKYELSFSLAL